jgi:hypothetical protein
MSDRTDLFGKKVADIFAVNREIHKQEAPEEKSQELPVKENMEQSARGGMSADEFKRYAERAKGMKDEHLHYAMKDIQKAIKAGKGMPGNKEGWYSDEHATYDQELRNRQKNTKK